MGELLTRVLPLAVGAAISPTVLAVALLIMSSDRRPVARGVAFVGGVVVVVAGLTAAGLAVSGQVGKPSHMRVEITRTIDLVVGVLLLVLAASTVLRMLTAHRAAATDPTDPADPTAPDAATTARHHDGLVTAGLLGAAMMLSNFSTILLYLPAMHAISRSHVPDGQKVVVVVVVAFITTLPATAPLLMRVVAPGPAARTFGVLHSWVTRHSAQVALVVELVFGAWLVWKGLR